MPWAEPRRRAILNYLALQERPVGEIVDSLGLEQPSVRNTCAFYSRWALSTCGATAGTCCIEPTPKRSGPFTSGPETFERYWRHQLSRVKNAPSGKTMRQTTRDRISLQGGKNDHDGNKN